MILRPLSSLQYALQTAKSNRVEVLVLISTAFEPLMPTVNHYTLQASNKSFSSIINSSQWRALASVLSFFEPFLALSERRREHPYLHILEILLHADTGLCFIHLQACLES